MNYETKKNMNDLGTSHSFFGYKKFGESGIGHPINDKARLSGLKSIFRRFIKLLTNKVLTLASKIKFRSL